MFKEKKKLMKVVEKAKQKLEELNENHTPVSVPSFDKEVFKEKVEKDALFFEHLYNSLIGDEKLKSKFDDLVLETVILAKEIYEEVGVKPKMISPAIEYTAEPLSEEEIVNYYKRAFNLILEHEFNSKLRKHQIIYENIENDDTGGQCTVKKVVSPEIKAIMIKCVKDGILDNNDPEAVAKYIAAEKAVVDAVKNVFIPEKSMQVILAKKNQLPDDYNEIFGNKLDTNLELFNQQAHRIGSLLAPFIFIKALRDAGYNVNFDPSSVAGISADISSCSTRDTDSADDID